MLSAREYQFANCRVSSQAREVWLEGVLQEVPPRVFDLLLYLLKYHDRVVSKQEILEEIWLGRVVTDNVVSRAIMIARSVIGDSKTNPVLIKTVQRVGYRFVGSLRLAGADRSTPGWTTQTRPVTKSGVRLALLPFQNSTGDAALAWIELGLPTLVNQAIRQDDRVEALTATAVLGALEDLPPRLSSEEVALHVLRVLGASCLIQATLRRAGQDYVLEYLAYGQHAVGIAGRFQGTEVTALAQSLARLVARSLFREDTDMVPFESSEPFANECFARAMQALDQHGPAKALDLMRVVRRLQPESSAVALVYLRALSETGHEDTFKVAEQLIERGRTSYDSYLENSARKILATAMWQDRQDLDAADRVLDRIFAADAPNPMRDWYVDALLTRARMRVELGDLAASRDILNQVFAFSDQIKNQMLLVSAMNSRAVIEAKDGNLWQAREAFREVCSMFKHLDKPLGGVIAQSNLGITNFHLGLIDDAVAEAAGAMKVMGTFPAAPQKHSNAIVSAATIFAHAHESGHISDLLDMLLDGPWAECTAGDDVLLSMVRGFYNYSTGDQAAAGDMFVAAINSVNPGDRRQHRTLVPIVAMHLARAARFDDVRRVRALLDASAATLFPWIPSFMLHIQAVEASISGDHLGARQLMLSAFDKATGGFAEALLRIDLAWSHICAGEFDVTRALCKPIAPWLTQHPAGMVVLAALEFSAGRINEMSRLLDTHFKKVGGLRYSRFAGLSDGLLAAAAASKSADLSGFMQLPTTYLLQRPGVAACAAKAGAKEGVRLRTHETSLER
jgi:DNA-binding winged helix-turn-helix (wHTH) protein/tetratricopeptide (TPR) repeat protein